MSHVHVHGQFTHCTASVYHRCSNTQSLMICVCHFALHIGVDCACMDSDHPPVPRGGLKPGETRVVVPPAAAPAYLSPWTTDQEVATRNVLAQVHPDLYISHDAITVLMRLQDNLAHYLLRRAFSGLNPPHRPGRSAEELARMPQHLIEEDQTYSEMYAAAEADPTHAIHFALPDGLCIPEISLHALSEQIKAQSQFCREGEMDHLSPNSFQFQAKTVGKKWWLDFQKGIELGPEATKIMAEARRRQQEKEDLMEKKTGRKAPTKKKKQEVEEEEKANASAAAAAGSSSAASAAAVSPSPSSSAETKDADETIKKPSYILFPEVLQHEIEQVGLCAMVEYITAELIELAGNRALDRGSAAIHLIDLYIEAAQDEELSQLVKFLHACWALPSADLSQPTPLLERAHAPPSAPEESFGLPPVEFILEEEYRSALSAQNALNKGSWYHTPALVEKYAREFARGVRKIHPVQQSLANLHVRPLRFYGCDMHLVLSDRPDHEAGQEVQAVDAFSAVSFAVTDGADREWSFLLEVSPHQSWKGCVSELDNRGSVIGFLARMHKDGIDTLRVDLATCENIMDPESGVAYTPRASEIDELEAEIVKQVAKLKEQLDAHRAKTREEKKKAEQAKAAAVINANAVNAVVESIVDAVSEIAESKENSGVAAAAGSSSSSSAFLEASLGRLALGASSSSSSESASSSSSSSSSAGAGGSFPTFINTAAEFDPFSIFAPVSAGMPEKSASSAAAAAAGPKKSNFKGPRGLSAAAAAAAVASTAVAAASPVSTTEKQVSVFRAPTVSLGSQQSLASLSALLGGITAHSSRSKVQSELEELVPFLLHLCMFSRWGPTLYTANHPPAVRRAFTVAVLDEAMSLAHTVDGYGDAAAAPSSAASSASVVAASTSVLSPLPQIPIVLLDLIAQYHSFDLPYIQSEAEQQLAKAGWLPQPQNRQAYPGQVRTKRNKQTNKQ